MASAQYIIEIDFDKDQTYSHANSDITAYVLDMSWNNGLANDEQEFANPATLRLTLDNKTGAFNLEESTATFFGLFKKGQLVRVRTTFASTTYTLFIGKIRKLPRIDVPTYSALQVQLEASDFMLELLDAEFSPTLQTNVTTDTALKQVFDGGAVAFPYDSSYWLLDSSGASQLDTTTILFNGVPAYSFETGQSTLAYVGDASGSENTVRAQQFLRDVVAAELGGRFWFDTRAGKFTFHDRHQDLNPTSVVTLGGDDYEDVNYDAEGTVYNEVTVHYYPREVGAAASILWSAEDPIALAKGESKTITARYKDPDNPDARIAGMDMIVPIKTTDYAANEEEDGGGTDRTDQLGVSPEFFAQSAKLTLVNNLKRTIYVTALQVRGTPLRSFNRESVSMRDADSIEDYDRQYKTVSVKYLDNEDTARNYAGMIASQYKNPITRFKSLTFVANKNDTRMTQALTRAIGDAITVQFADIDHDKVYIIVGERHNVRGGGDHAHEVTWILKPINNITYWVLEETGYTELGETTILAF